MSKPQLRTITGAELGNLQIDDRRQLYWRGERIRNQITLSWLQTVSAAIVVLASLATIFNGVSSGLNNLSTFSCSRGWGFPIAGCPIPPAPR